MKNQRIKQVVVLETTPDELRKIAEILDKKWDRARLGDDVPKYTLFERDGLEVEISSMIEKHRLEHLEKTPHECSLHEVREMAAEVLRLRNFARDIRDNYDHDSDGHKYDTYCRKCEAEALLPSGEG